MNAETFARRLASNLRGSQNAGARKALVAAARAFDRGETIWSTLSESVYAKAKTIAFTTGGLCCIAAALSESEGV